MRRLMSGVVSGLSAVQAMKDVKSICGEGWWAVGAAVGRTRGTSRSEILKRRRQKNVGKIALKREWTLTHKRML